MAIREQATGEGRLCSTAFRQFEENESEHRLSSVINTPPGGGPKKKKKRESVLCAFVIIVCSLLRRLSISQSDTTVELMIHQAPFLPSLATLLDRVKGRLSMDVTNDFALALHDL